MPIKLHVSTADRPNWLAESDYPFALQSVQLGNHEVTFVDEGAGPTLLFVHTGMWSFIFRDVITRLRDHFRCITLDLPGYGLSPEPAAGDLSLAEQSELLQRFVATLDLNDITLVLHDLGGPVGMGFAANAPARVRGLVMANTFAWAPEGKSLRLMLGIVASRPVTALDWLTRLVPRLSATSFGVGRHLDRSGRKAFLGPFADRRRIRRFHTTMRAALDADELYGSIEAATAGALRDRPVLTIFGESNDPFGFQGRHQATFANVESIVVPKGNHFPMMDAPDLFAAGLLDWWTRQVK